MFHLPTTLTKIIGTTIFTLFIAGQANSQVKKGEFINVAIGYGLTSPYDDTDVLGTGFYAQGEYVYNVTKWFGLRPYVGLVLTKTRENNNQQSSLGFEANTAALLIGGKARISAPIPWVAPYFEIGIGASLGSFETVSLFADFKEKGVQMHIPFALGLQLGRKHNFDFAFTYYFHPAVEQFSGAVAFGVSFPLN